MVSYKQKMFFQNELEVIRIIFVLCISMSHLGFATATIILVASFPMSSV